jgi:hypothetical protein
VLTLYVGDSITGAEISRRGRALMATAAAVTEEVGGTPLHTRKGNPNR